MNYLINDKYLTENTNVSGSLKDKTFKVAMQSVTIMNIRPLLGTPLYELYENHVQNDTELTPKQAELFESIQYYMALRVEREMMYNLLSVTNKGVTQEEHVANMEVVNVKRQDIEAKSDYVKRIILKYLEANKEDFPEFYPEPSKDTPVKNTTYSTGIVFDYEPKKYFM